MRWARTVVEASQGGAHVEEHRRRDAGRRKACRLLVCAGLHPVPHSYLSSFSGSFSGGGREADVRRLLDKKQASERYNATRRSSNAADNVAVPHAAGDTAAAIAPRPSAPLSGQCQLSASCTPACALRAIYVRHQFYAGYLYAFGQARGKL